MAARRLSNSQSSDSSVSSFGEHDRTFPRDASSWTLGHLNEIGIYYDNAAIDLEQFMSCLKTRGNVIRDGLDKMPQISNAFDLTSRVWTFSFAFDEEKGDTVHVAEANTIQAITEFKEKNNEIQENFLLKGIRKFHYYSWSSALKDFWNYFLMLLWRWHKPAQGEGKYTELLRAFSKIFLLMPESGEAYRESINIIGVYVQGSPAIRFLTRPYKGLQQLLFVVTQVKSYKAFKGEYHSDSFTYDNIQPDVLGQHGIELLLEAKEGYFSPYVVGILCIGTKVIFTSMYIELDAYNEIS
ncbi:hypothetical protein FSP39_009725 [Pinctada imbricata]|uniref:Uncharacterized protein n=1 Tax=Pinctada imbricata TaxID=66713 RepID=A0AA89C4D3_PINIB|nr:hypothetical protein FSP39_009725 [Pinctada imbricata]